jgi:hypothetical protein
MPILLVFRFQEGYNNVPIVLAFEVQKTLICFWILSEQI